MSIENLKAGFIGFGSMASAIVQGWKNNEVIPMENVAASAARFESLCQRAENYGIAAMKTNQDVCRFADIVIVAVKPDLVSSVLEECREILKEKTVISLAAGITGSDLAKMVPDSARLVIMPNLCIAAGQGIVLFEQGYVLDAAQEKAVRSLFEPVALVETLPASKFRAAGTIAGCAPAWAAMFTEALADAGVMYGLSRAEAYELCAKVVEGTGALILSQRISPAALKDQVCSPKGTTIKGVYALEKNGLRSAVMQAVEAVEKSCG